MKTAAARPLPLTLSILYLGAFFAAPPAVADDAGKAAYDQRCARCHTVEQAVGFLNAHPDAAERAQWLENKLSRHHARDAKDRAAIITFLEDALAKMK